jgi:hypothetical protein
MEESVKSSAKGTVKEKTVSGIVYVTMNSIMYTMQGIQSNYGW